MATKYEALVEARLVGSSIQKAINAQASNAKVYINNVHVNPSAVRKSIQNQLNAGKFTMNLKDVNVAGLSEKLSASMRKSLGNQKIVLNNITLNTQGLGAKIQSALDGKKFKLNLTEVKINNLSNTITGQVKQAAKQASTEANAAANAHKKQAEAAKAAADAERKLAKETADAAKQQLLLTKANTLSNKIEDWANKNAAAAKRYKAELDRIRETLSNPNLSGDQFKQAAANFDNIKAKARSAGLVISQYAASFKNFALQMVGLGSAYQIGMKVFQTLSKGVNTVVDLDTALVDLRKTSTMTGSDLEDFYRDANKEAKNLGVTTEEIITQAAQWSRLGYGSKHDATLMARLSSQFAAISPGMSVTDATDSLVSTMKAFGIETDQVLDGVMSKINILGNSFALSNKDLADALQVSSASMKAANNSFEQTLALITAGTEITQDASRVGNGLRTISMRIRALDEETGEYDETLGNIKNDISELTHGKVSIMEDEHTYRSTYDILKRISEIWGELTDKEQAGLLEKLFGKNRAQIGMAILSNFSAAEEAMEKMENSAGNADKEMSIIMDSLEYKLNALKETGTGIWQNLFPRESIGAAIDGLTAFANVLEKITGFLGPGGTLLAAGGIAGITALIKNFGQPSEGSLNSEIFKLAYYGQEHAVMVA